MTEVENKEKNTRPPGRILLAAARAADWVITRPILSVLFLVVFIPVGLTMRRLRRDPLGQRIEPEAESYWQPRRETENQRSRMEHMF